MTELNIPNLNKKSDKYIFKNKLSLKRKPKKKLLIESFYMMILGLFLIYLNYLIPNKVFIFTNFSASLSNIFLLMFELLSYIYEIILVLFMIISLVLAVILIVGSMYRIFKVLKRKTKNISFK